MLEIKNLSFSYPRNPRTVIDNVNVAIEYGSVYGLLGPNGAGKSTLLYLISGLLTPKTGEVILNGHNTRRRMAETLQEIFIVPEEFNLPNVTVKKYAELQMKYYPRFSMEQMRANLQKFDLDDQGLNLAALSMGQKKKVFMSFALAANTQLMLMDEPTNGLDIPGKVAFRSFIASNMSDQRAIIISTHQVRDVDQILDKVLIMNSNSIVFKSDMYDIAQRLKFVSTFDKDLIEQALISVPDTQGMRIAIPNDGNGETEVDLELLFELVTKHPDAINSLMQQPK